MKILYNNPIILLIAVISCAISLQMNWFDQLTANMDLVSVADFKRTQITGHNVIDSYYYTSKIGRLPIIVIYFYYLLILGTSIHLLIDKNYKPNLNKLLYFGLILLLVCSYTIFDFSISSPTLGLVIFIISNLLIILALIQPKTSYFDLENNILDDNIIKYE